MEDDESFEFIDSHLMNGRKENYNIFIVDWSVMSMNINYFLAAFQTKEAGSKLAGFIDWLQTEGGLKFETTHLTGFSLGAHLAGFAGKQVTKGKLKVIVGLDPAFPFFKFESPENRLAYTDAEYVETIHTSKNGFFNPIGKASFYPNGSLRQPGCGIDIVGACAHSRATTFFAEAVARISNNSFNTVKCGDLVEMSQRKCSGDSEGVKMGDPENYKKAKGIYYLVTRAQAPFGV